MIRALLLTILLLFSGELNKKMDNDNGGDDRVAQFLNAISNIESSGGRNTNHPEMESGIHAGQAAIGRYGLMPNTVNEVLNRMRLNGTLTEDLDQLRDLDPDTLRSALESRPDLEQEVAKSLANRVLERQGDEERAAYSWNQGHNLTPEQISEKPYRDSDYVRKYNMYKKLSQGD